MVFPPWHHFSPLPNKCPSDGILLHSLQKKFWGRPQARRRSRRGGLRPPVSAAPKRPAAVGCGFPGAAGGGAKGCGGGWEGKLQGVGGRRSRARPQAGPRARSARGPRVRGAAAPYFAGYRRRRGRQKGRPGRGAPIAACGFSGFSAGHGSRPAAFPHWRARAGRRGLPPRQAFPAWHGRYLPP